MIKNKIMNKLEETLATILEKALNLAEQTGDFVLDQAPDLLKQFFMWHTWESILGIILFLIISLVVHLTIRWFAKEEDDNFYYIFEFFQIIPIIFLCVNIYQLVFILVAPKLYLIEYFIK